MKNKFNIKKRRRTREQISHEAYANTRFIKPDGSFDEDAALKSYEKFYNDHFKPGHAEAIGKVLFTHLIFEKLLIELLEKANPNLKPIPTLRLGFSKLVDIAERSDVTVRPGRHMINALKALNRIRNALAHNHVYSGIKDSDLEPLRAFYREVTKGGDPTNLKSIELIEWFLLAGTGAMLTQIDGIEASLTLTEMVRVSLANLDLLKNPKK